jgi:dihydroorotase
VISGLLTATELWQALSVNPAKILGLAPPKLSTLFEPCLEWLAKDSAISSQSRNSNYMGRSIIGKVLA